MEVTIRKAFAMNGEEGYKLSSVKLTESYDIDWSGSLELGETVVRPDRGVGWLRKWEIPRAAEKEGRWKWGIITHVQIYRDRRAHGPCFKGTAELRYRFGWEPEDDWTEEQWEADRLRVWDPPPPPRAREPEDDWEEVDSGASTAEEEDSEYGDDLE